ASKDSKSTQIDVDQLTRLNKRLEGSVQPETLPRISEYLAAPGGEIQYRFSGALEADATGRQVRRMRCIISGWFFLADSHSMEPGRFDLDVDSTLRLVSSELDLPPLEAEAEDEDVIVAGKYLDLIERLEEEILLALPVTAVALGARSGETKPSANKQEKPSKDSTQDRPSPFAKLASLKKH
ncbi:MAG: DUF177 domain-containing protein, partial [Betaproteobacteria bacterium]|nr:DUF177 domain-containing protein [Betaproteobacteria bacterium]